MIIRQDSKIELKEGFQTVEIDTDQDLKLELNAMNSGNLFFRIRNAGKIEIHGTVPEEKDVSILFWNDTDKKIETDESYEVEKNGSLSLAYGECNEGDTLRSVQVDLKGRSAHVDLSSASLARSRKEYRMFAVNEAERTSAEIKNYAVVLKDGKLMIDAVGKIVNGAKRSKSHQVSRALSFEEGQNTTILPELLIDENDVEASHAMSIGRVDEDQLYYMMSRGLNLKECTMLISLGYLLPITDIIDNEEMRKTLREELERKIAELCLM